MPSRVPGPLAPSVLALLVSLAPGRLAAQIGPVELSPEPGVLKGQLHLHTSRSGDSRTPVGDVVRFYDERGYDFIVVTDHNHVTEAPPGSDLLVLAGAELTRNTPACRPVPERGLCLVHVNALFVGTARGRVELPRQRAFTRLDLYRQHLELTRELGGIAMINHPNFRYTVTPEVAVALAGDGARLIEVANQAMTRSNGGDARHLSVEALWDHVLTSGADLWGVASDDAHHYHDAHQLIALGRRPVYPADRGWIMVRAARDPEAIRAAVERGEFYSSTGVLLHAWHARDGALEIAAAGPGPFVVEFVGEGGTLLGRHEGAIARFPLAAAAGGYVRARVLGPDGTRAWTQPVRVPATPRLSQLVLTWLRLTLDGLRT